MKVLAAICALILATSVLAGCGGLSRQQRTARRETTQLLTYMHLGYAHPKVTSIDIRGGNWADVVVQGRFRAAAPTGIPNVSHTGQPTTSHPAAAPVARRILLGFALRDPKHSWRMSYDFGHGFGQGQ
jgi:hypothetical protein